MKKLPKKELVREFTVVRDKWVRGSSDNVSQLLNEQGERCCIGFYAEACGFRPKEIRGVGTLSTLNRKVKYGKRTARAEESVKLDHDKMPADKDLDDLFFSTLYEINDDSLISDKTREKKITERFAKVGVKVRFE